MFRVSDVQGSQSKPSGSCRDSIDTIRPDRFLIRTSFVGQSVRLESGVCDPFKIRVALIFVPSVQKSQKWFQEEGYSYNHDTEDVGKEESKEIERSVLRAADFLSFNCQVGYIYDRKTITNTWLLQISVWVVSTGPKLLFATSGFSVPYAVCTALACK